MKRLTSRQAIKQADDTVFIETYCHGHRYGPAAFPSKYGTSNPQEYKNYCEMVDTIAEYEDTELTPGEIQELIKSEDYWHRDAIKWAAQLGEYRMKFRKILNGFGIPENNFTDDEIERFLFSTRQQDMKE
jgi:hypothetical protein